MSDMLIGLRQQIIGGLITLGVAAITTYGFYLADSVAEVKESVEVVHDLTNSQFTELQAELAAANQRNAELSERIGELSERLGNMVPAERDGP